MKKQIKEILSYCFSYITIVLTCISCNFWFLGWLVWLFGESFLNIIIPPNDTFFYIAIFILCTYPLFSKILLIALWIICKKFYPQCILAKFFNNIRTNNPQKIIIISLSIVIDCIIIFIYKYFTYPYLDDWFIKTIKDTALSYIVIHGSISLNFLALYIIWFIIDIAKNIKNKE